MALFIERLSGKEDIHANLHRDQSFLSGIMLQINEKVSTQDQTFFQLAFSPLFHFFFKFKLYIHPTVTFHGFPKVKVNMIYLSKR